MCLSSSCGAKNSFSYRIELTPSPLNNNNLALLKQSNRKFSLCCYVNHIIVYTWWKYSKFCYSCLCDFIDGRHGHARTNDTKHIQFCQPIYSINPICRRLVIQYLLLSLLCFYPKQEKALLSIFFAEIVENWFYCELIQ